MNNFSKAILCLACILFFSCHSSHQKISDLTELQSVKLPHILTRVDSFTSSLSAKQKEQTLLPFHSPKRTQWHYIPKKTRHGLTLHDMNPQQYQLMQNILKTVLSKSGIQKVNAVMQLEQILRELEGPHRDPKKYYFSIYGQPGKKDWGFSFEGHHLSLNFTFHKSSLISCTPMFLGANPALVPSNKTSQLRKGEAPLHPGQTLCFKLLNSLSPELKKQVILPKISQGDMKEGHHPLPQHRDIQDGQGIRWSQLSPKQQQLLLQIIQKTSTENLQPKIASVKLKTILQNKDSLKLLFYGKAKNGHPLHYTISGKNFLFLFFNTRKGSQGKPANHIHQVWRSHSQDFGFLHHQHSHPH